MKLELATKWKLVPRNENGDPAFIHLGTINADPNRPRAVLEVFSQQEVVELVNRALYQIEYQAGSHKKYGKIKRAQEKLLKEELRKRGIDPTKQKVKDELEGK